MRKHIITCPDLRVVIVITPSACLVIVATAASSISPAPWLTSRTTDCSGKARPRLRSRAVDHSSSSSWNPAESEGRKCCLIGADIAHDIARGPFRDQTSLTARNDHGEFCITHRPQSTHVIHPSAQYTYLGRYAKLQRSVVGTASTRAHFATFRRHQDQPNIGGHKYTLTLTRARLTLPVTSDCAS